MIHDSAVTTYKNPEKAPWALGPSSLYVLMTDPRLTDARVPLPHTHPMTDVIGLPAALGNFVLNTDPRLSDARVPVTHTHVISDVIGLAAALAADPFAGTAAGGDLGGTYPNPEVRALERVDEFTSLRLDFEQLVRWVVETFGDMPAGLEERFERATNT